MGLFDGLSDALKGVLGQSGQQGGAGLIGPLLAQTNLGSLQGIAAQLQQSGLGARVQSWLGDGTNLPVSADEIRSALDDEHVQQIARHLGLPVDTAMQFLAQHLPQAVDQASPDGTLPAAA